MHIHKPQHSVQKPAAVALSSQEAQWVRLAVATNNLANAHVPGFKAQMVHLVNTTQKGKEDRVVHYVSANRTLRSLTTGSYRHTGNPFDVALNGNGYFMVDTGKGKYLTRNGQFALHEDGSLIMACGSYAVLGQDGDRIVIPKMTKNVVINPEGGVYADSELVGILGVFNVANQQEELKSLGNHLLDPGDQDVSLANSFSVRQFGVEESNVSGVVEGMIMMDALRQFENAQKVIEEQDQSSKKVFNVSAKNVA